MHGPKAGVAHDFDEAIVQEIAETLFKEQRRKDMEQAYLERLQERIEEEDAGKAGETPKTE